MKYPRRQSILISLTNCALLYIYTEKYCIRYMRAPHMFFFSVKVFEKVSKLENSPFYRNGLQY